MEPARTTATTGHTRGDRRPDGALGVAVAGALGGASVARGEFTDGGVVAGGAAGAAGAAPGGTVTAGLDGTVTAGPDGDPSEAEPVASSTSASTTPRSCSREYPGAGHGVVVGGAPVGPASALIGTPFGGEAVVVAAAAVWVTPMATATVSVSVEKVATTTADAPSGRAERGRRGPGSAVTAAPRSDGRLPPPPLSAGAYPHLYYWCDFCPDATTAAHNHGLVAPRRRARQ